MGNTLAVYTKEDQDPIKLSEQHLYGSSRVGIINLNINVPANVSWPTLSDTMQDGFDYGKTVIELSNHLQNVLVTVSDKKIGVDADNNGAVDYYNADVVSAQDYYPFGQLMPGRQWGTAGRYLFNGKEQDPEVKGIGAQYDYGFRIYDPRVVRFLSVDPLSKSYPWYTPYQFAGNKFITSIDLDGLEEFDFRERCEDDGSVTIIITTGRSTLDQQRLAVSTANGNVTTPYFKYKIVQEEMAKVKKCTQLYSSVM